MYLMYQPVLSTCCIYMFHLPVMYTCCLYLLYLPVEPIFVSTSTFCNYKKCTCCIYLLYLPVVHFVVLPSPAKELVGVPVHSQHLFLGHRWHAPKYGHVWQSETGQLIIIDWCVHMCNMCYMYQMCIPLKRDTLPLMISKAVGHKKITFNFLLIVYYLKSHISMFFYKFDSPPFPLKNKTTIYPNKIHCTSLHDTADTR